MKRVVLPAMAAVVYVLAAWAVSPGFFDGLAPPAPYHWVSPPPDFRSTNKPPDMGQATVAVKSGLAQSGHVATADSQASLSFPSQSFRAPADGSSVTVDIKPAGTFPDLGGIQAAGNVYSITTSTQLISPAVITLRYVQLHPEPPSQIFAAAGPAGPWKALPPVNTAVPNSVAGSAQSLGYFVVGYPPAGAATPSSAGSSGGQSIPVLPIVILVAVGVTLLAGLPLLVTRRRMAKAESEQPAAQAPARNLGGARRRTGRRGRR